MNAQGLRACVHKELLLLSRDLHGLALLFIMPLAFILIMSLALQNQFAEHAGQKLSVLSVDRDGSEASKGLLASLSDNSAFTVNAANEISAEALRQRLRRGEHTFAVILDAGFNDRLTRAPSPGDKPLVSVLAAPDAGKQIEAVFVASLRAALGQQRLRELLTKVGANAGDANAAGGEVHVQYAYGDASGSAAPTAVQQSVPAWLVFAVFFVVVPLSNTLIRERQLGTLRRLRSTNLGKLTVLWGKLIPYFVVNQLQVVIMLLAGRYLVPLLGGEALMLNGSWLLLAAIAASLSIAALGLALLIAVASGTTEQATLLGGTGNIILAAVGGIMIPKFVMPAAMQRVSEWSPMSWGLEGFLDVLLRGGSFRDIAPEAACLTSLGLVAILLAGWLQQRRID